MTENEVKTIDDCLKKLKDHRDVYLKRSTPWRIVNRAVRFIEELKQYRAIGTVEECRCAVEKMKPKKILKRGDFYKCRICNHWVGFGYGYCDGCGQKLDWSE